MPPRKEFQMNVARVSASLSPLKVTPPPAPPRERVRILPFAWQVLKLEDSAEQSARAVPGNVALSTLLHDYGSATEQSS